MDRCSFSDPLDDIGDSTGVAASQLISIGADGLTTMSASVAVQVDGFSLMVVAYIVMTTPPGNSTYSIAIVSDFLYC